MFIKKEHTVDTVDNADREEIMTRRIERKAHTLVGLDL